MRDHARGQYTIGVRFGTRLRATKTVCLGGLTNPDGDATQLGGGTPSLWIEASGIYTNAVRLGARLLVKKLLMHGRLDQPLLGRLSTQGLCNQLCAVKRVADTRTVRSLERGCVRIEFIRVIVVPVPDGNQEHQRCVYKRVAYTPTVCAYARCCMLVTSDGET